jgi:hypothetical protein
LILLKLALTLQKFIIQVNNLFTFLKNPSKNDFQYLSKKDKLKETLFFLLPFEFLIGAVILWYPIELGEYFKLYDKLVKKESIQNLSDFSLYFTTCLIAPLFEEFVFRYPLKFFKAWKYFGIIFYFTAIVFGMLHFLNYEYNHSHLLFAPFIVMSQIWGGLVLGYIRIKYGFWYGFLNHALFNFFCIIWDKLVGFDIF